MKILLLIITFILFTSAFLVGAYYHEQVHVAIYESFGMKNISISYSFSHFETHAYGECNDYCQSANMNNEVVGYNLVGVFLAIFILTMVLIVLKDKEEY
jgi:hypothetical protein